MSWLHALASFACLGLAVYLLYALLNAEEF